MLEVGKVYLVIYIEGTITYPKRDMKLIEIDDGFLTFENLRTKKVEMISRLNISKMEVEDG